MLENRLTVQAEKRKKDDNDIIYLHSDKIIPNPYQPRKFFDNESLRELSNSIKTYGIIQPLSVRKIGNDKYELIAGERRLRAAGLAGVTKIPCMVVNVGDNDSALMALIENLQRENLNYIEEAQGYYRILKEHNMTQESLAAKLGKSQSTIANKLRLLKLSPMVTKILLDNNLTERHARCLLRLPDDESRLQVLKKICEENLNVKRSENLVEKVLSGSSEPQAAKSKEDKRKKVIQDIRVFVKSVKQAVNVMLQAGVKAKAAQFDRGTYIEFIIRIPKQ
ncbi:MAG: nucleoid occlusion protein [Clostridia bacterium]|jgi:ParB family chromosome partitioning protein|nr:nucleoid occlusion protein [Clostridiaceae bacterium]